MKKLVIFLTIIFIVSHNTNAQTQWVNVDALYEPLPSSVHVFKSDAPVDGRPNIMYYAIADLQDTNLRFTTDTTLGRRIAPQKYFVRNGSPLLVVNGTFFSFASNRNLSAVVTNGQVVGYNNQTQKGRGKDSAYYVHSFTGTFGIYQNRTADIAWTFSDSSLHYLYASQEPEPFVKDTLAKYTLAHVNSSTTDVTPFSKWKVTTAIGGGPVLVQAGEIKITNNEERKFSGKAIDDRHPRTAIGYTSDHKIIVLVCEGRSERAAGLSLRDLATIMQNLGCEEALNLDGGGSSCMLINGKETNYPSSKGQQRPVPSVFMIERR